MWQLWQLLWCPPKVAFTAARLTEAATVDFMFCMAALLVGAAALASFVAMLAAVVDVLTKPSGLMCPT